MKRILHVLVLMLAAQCVSSAGAVVNDEAAVRAIIAQRFPGLTSDDVHPAPVPGLYEVMVGPVVIYASADGRYVIKGDIYDLETERNLTEARVNTARAHALEKLSEEDLIVFGDPDAEYSITVFTDVTCTYCRKLHSEIDEYIRRGIRVRYAAYPRNGMASKGWQQMEDVWCATDRRRALTLAKLDRKFETQRCDSDAVTQQWQLGRLLGVGGTPAIFLPDGKMVPGYLPPDVLVKRLEASPHRE